MPAKTGILITFEGTEGAGKSTLIREIRNQLIATGLLGPAAESCIRLTREPGGSPVAEKIRSVILSEAMDPWTELFLYEAARAEHLAQTILPALNAGHLVLCDRFTDSSLAYQSQARGLPWNAVKSLNRIATRGLKPDLSVLLDIDPAVGLARAQDKNRFEDEGVEFQKTVRKGFLRSRREDPKRWVVIRSDGGTPEQNARKVVQVILKRFSSRLKKMGKPGVRGKA